LHRKISNKERVGGTYNFTGVVGRSSAATAVEKHTNGTRKQNSQGLYRSKEKAALTAEARQQYRGKKKKNTVGAVCGQ
jgi:hypothetical protein